jgi:endonuclease/exonuclease/phosphatase family metal-dependent hydrolase
MLTPTVHRTSQRVAVFITCASVTAALATVSPPAHAGVAAAPVAQATAAAHGSTLSRGGLAVRLANTVDGRIRVSWKPPAGPSTVRGFVVRVGPNRALTTKTRSTAVSRARHSAVVSRAFGATTASGNFSFVKVLVKRKNGRTGSSSTTWIQAPPEAGCSSPSRVTVGSFNVRTWAEKTPDARRFPWNVRGPRVIRQILNSGVGVVAIQEASGQAGRGYGKLRQNTWILRHLNAESDGAHWQDVLSDDAYNGGLVGTRLFYDANRFSKLEAGLADLTTRGSVRRSPAPWARLRAVDGRQSPFVMISAHLQRGESRKDFRVRGRQADKLIAVSRQLRDRYNDQVILGGDLNSTVYSKPYNNVQLKLLRAGFYDAFATADLRGSGFPTTNDFDFPVRATPHRRDYLMSLGLERGSCQYRNRAYRSASNAASDHFMQVATLPLPAVAAQRNR